MKAKNQPYLPKLQLLLGSNAAAQYLGMRQQEFYRIVQNLLNPPPRVAAYQRKVDAVKNAYPELFAKCEG